ncbi:hypothetical protein [Blastococcus sp. SYSU D00813]
MTSPTGWDVSSPRAVTTPVDVPPRQPTLEWTRPPAATHVAPPPAEPLPPEDRPRAQAGRLAPVVGAALVSAATVWALMTVGPLAGDRAAGPAQDVAKAEPERTDTGWQPLAVSGGFVVTGDGARYRVVDGICYLQVHLRDPDGIWAANAPIAMLPAAARPAWNHDFVASRDGVPYSEVGVYDDGQVLMSRPGDGVVGWLTVSASFPVGH